MIDITRTRTQLLTELEANNCGAVTIALPSQSPIPTNALGAFRGHRVKEIFSILKAEISERFADVPRPELIRDVLAPLKNALGNAYKHGNRRDRAKWISIEIALSPRGVLVAITDEGAGFDVASAFRDLRAGYRAGEERGAGFRNLDRAHSVISYENDGRTFLLCFRPAADGEAVQSADDRGVDPALLKVLNPEWMQQCLSTEIAEFSDGPQKLRACRPYAGKGRAADRCGIRYILTIHGQGPELRILTGRLHVDAGAAETDFDAASKLYGHLRSSDLRIPRPIARLQAEPRLVLSDFDAWMNLWEYLEDRGTPQVLRTLAEQAGEALARLHQSQVSLKTGEPLAERLRRMCARLESVLEPAARPMVESIRERIGMFDSRELVPSHGAFGWNSIHYGVDRGFYLYRFENCGLSVRELDLGGFLADLVLFSAIQDDAEAAVITREALLGVYGALAGHPAIPDALRVCTAVALLERLDPNLHPGFVVSRGIVLEQCERVLRGDAGL
jgi:hypothetical protein